MKFIQFIQKTQQTQIPIDFHYNLFSFSFFRFTCCYDFILLFPLNALMLRSSKVDNFFWILESFRHFQISINYNLCIFKVYIDVFSSLGELYLLHRPSNLSEYTGDHIVASSTQFYFISSPHQKSNIIIFH